MDCPREDDYDREARRCLVSGPEFRAERAGRRRILRRADVRVETLTEALRAHDEQPEGRFELLKADPRGRVTRVASHDARRPSLCIKEFRRARPAQRLLDRLTGSRARRAWIGAHACRVRGLPVPEPLGLVEQAGRSFFVTAFLAGTQPLVDWVADHARPGDGEARRRWEAVLDAAADLVAALHAHRLRHRDLAPKNLLLRDRDDRPELFLTDLGDVRLGRAPDPDFKVRNLGQLAQLRVQVDDADLLRFFRRYAARHPEVDRPERRRAIHALARRRHARWLERGGRKWLAERRRLGKPV